MNWKDKWTYLWLETSLISLHEKSPSHDELNIGTIIDYSMTFPPAVISSLQI